MPRFAELKNLDVIAEVGERVCTVTQRVVLVWDVTDSLPVETKRRKSLSRRAQIKRMAEVLTRTASETCQCNSLNKQCLSCEARALLAEIKNADDQGAA
jgi:hypothetical protein